MTLYHKDEWHGLNIKTEPNGMQKLYNFIPYFTGIKPRIRMVIETDSAELTELVKGNNQRLLYLCGGQGCFSASRR